MKEKENKISVLHLIGKLCRRSGPEQIVLSLLKKMDRYYFTNRVAILQDSKLTEKSLLEEESVPSEVIHLIPWHKRRLLLDGIWNLRKIISLEGVQVLHCHDNRATLLGLLVGRQMGLPLVRSVHGDLEHSFKLKTLYSIDKMLLRQFDRIIIGSEAFQVKIRNIPCSKVAIIHNAIDLGYAINPVNTGEVKRRFKIGEDVQIVCTIGRLHHEKGHLCLLQAAQKVFEKSPRVKFLIVGEGPLRKTLENSAKILGLNEHVILTGFQPDVHEILSISDLFVLSSMEESLPLSILEAMAHGKPIVSTNVGGINEAVIDGVNGLLVPPNNPGQLCQAILNLLNDPLKMKAMGAAGKSIVHSNFSDEKLVTKYQEVYESLVKTNLAKTLSRTFRGLKGPKNQRGG